MRLCGIIANLRIEWVIVKLFMEFNKAQDKPADRFILHNAGNELQITQQSCAPLTELALEIAQLKFDLANDLRRAGQMGEVMQEEIELPMKQIFVNPREKRHFSGHAKQQVAQHDIF